MAERLSTGTISDNGVRAAAPELLGSWAARGASLAQVAEALEALRRGQTRTATRTSVVNLVVAASDQAGAERSATAMRRLGTRHPGRTVVLSLGGAGTGMDASVELHSAQAGGRSVWWEEVRLAIPQELRAHALSVVEPLLLPDLPVVAWFPTALPAPDDDLAWRADAVLVDARAAGDDGAIGGGFPALAELAHRRPVVDLSWKRLTVLRRVLAEMFEPAACRRFAGGVHEAEVSGMAGPRRLVAGWLASRLALAPQCFSLRPAEHTCVRLAARSGGAAAEVRSGRAGGDLLVTGSVEVDGRVVHTGSAPLPDHGLSWSLAQGLGSLRRDPVYEQAVRAALAVGGPPA